MNDQALQALAAQHSLPPSLMYALHVMSEDKSDEKMTSLARLVSGAFQRTRNWEGAVSTALTGDPNTVNTPTNPASGTVNAVLGISASRPDWGVQGFQPVDMNAYAGGAKAMQKTAANLARLGGVVTPDHVQRWGQSITTVKHPPTPQGQTKPWPDVHAKDQGPPPDLAHAAAVGEFATNLKRMGMTPDHFRQVFPTIASTYRRLLGRSPELHDVAAHVGQTPDLILQAVRNMPAPGHPDHSAGSMMDTWKSAALHSIGYIQRAPYQSELTSFISGGMDHRDQRDYYKTLAQNPSGKIDVSKPEATDQGDQVEEGDQHG